MMTIARVSRAWPVRAATGLRASRTTLVSGRRFYSATPLHTPSTMTPPAFSLAGKLVVLTGASRGLGLVMGQAIVASGADLAMVDLNKDEAQEQASLMIEAYKDKYPGQRCVYILFSPCIFSTRI